MGQVLVIVVIVIIVITVIVIIIIFFFTILNVIFSCPRSAFVKSFLDSRTPRIWTGRVSQNKSIGQHSSLVQLPCDDCLTNLPNSGRKQFNLTPPLREGLKRVIEEEEEDNGCKLGDKHSHRAAAQSIVDQHANLSHFSIFENLSHFSIFENLSHFW